MNIKITFLFLSLIVVLGIGLTGTVVQVFSLWESQTVPRWHLEGEKTGQASLWGYYPHGEFGEALAVGDVNGDGFDDLIANARYAPGIVQDSGEVYVIPGPLAFNETYTMPHRAAITFQAGSASEEQIGVYLDSGDLNGDGFDDIVIGNCISGKAYVYLGSADIQAGTPITVAVSPENMALTIYPASDGLVLCDFNKDGYQDLFVERYPWDGNTDFGVKVWGALGSPALTMTHPVTLNLPADADITIEGFFPVEWYSPNLKNMACGDIDADGYPDLAIGIFGATPPDRHGAGIVYVVQGDPTITTTNPVTLTMPGQAGAIIEGTDGRQGSMGDELGASLAIADINQDGKADLIMGAPLASGPDNLVPYAGEVYLWLGRALNGQRFDVSSQASWIVHGEDPHDLLGTAIATGDFDNDGYPEILLGCQSCAREGAPLYLSGMGYVLEPAQITGPLTVTTASRLDIVPYQEARGLGWAVNSLDLDGDGVSDLMISAPAAGYPADNLPGTVYLISYPIHSRVYLPLVHR